jgi:dTDP-4-amino-4,6-dideoxygalactose transaminase
MAIPFFDLKIQNSALGEGAVKKFLKVFNSGSFILGEEVATLEENLAAYLGTKYAIGVSSGTDTILLALMALGIGPRDEVICPSFTFFGTAGCVARLGATPVFVDICPGDFSISPDGIRQKISEKTKAILPVHLFGQMADMDEIMGIGSEFGIPIVEDCAQSLGARRGGRQSGTIGTIGCFSFFPTKNLGGFGDGGFLCTANGDLAEKIRILRVHGMKPQYFHRYIGGNFRIDEMQAALLNVKLPHVDGYIEKRRHNASIYLEELGTMPGIVMPRENPTNFHTWNQITIRILNGRRDELLRALGKRNIGCKVYYPLPLDAQECFEKFVSGENLTQNAQIAADEVLSLPIYPELEREQILGVASAIKEILATEK